MRREATAEGKGWQRFGETSFTFRDEESGVVLRLRNCRSDSDGYTFGDVHAYQEPENPDGRPRLILMRPRVNFTSDRSLKPLAESLTKQFAFPWFALLEKVCAVLVTQMDRKGVVTLLQPVDEAELAQPMLFRDIVPRGLLSGFVAHGGTGKSLCGVMMAIAIATGTRVGPFVPLQQGPVLYLDWENDHKLHARRITRLCNGLGIPFPPLGSIVHYGARGKLSAAESEIVELAYEHETIVNILDSIGFAAGGNLNDNEVATQAVNVLKHVPGTSIMLAHVSKSSLIEPVPQKGPIGSTFFWNGPQAVYELKTTDPDPDGSQMFAIYQSKANVGKKLARPVGMQVIFEDPAGPITPLAMEIKGDGVGGEGLPLPVRVMDALAGIRERATAQQVADVLSMGDKAGLESVTRTLRELREKGRVHRFEKGPKGDTWGIAADGEPPRSRSVSDPEFVCVKCGKQATGYSDAGLALCQGHLQEE